MKPGDNCIIIGKAKIVHYFFKPDEFIVFSPGLAEDYYLQIYEVLENGWVLVDNCDLRERYLTRTESIVYESRK